MSTWEDSSEAGEKRPLKRWGLIYKNQLLVYIFFENKVMSSKLIA
jgi:hypothetical protein